MSKSRATVYLKDYKVPEYLIHTVALNFDIHDSHVIVENSMRMARNPKSTTLPRSNLVLNGVELELLKVELNGTALPETSFRKTEEEIEIFGTENLSNDFELKFTTRLYPQKNLALEGLYLSDGIYCTQCEAEGFRKITYYMDRPDVMAVYTVRVEAEATKFPYLLSNGNPMENKVLPNGRHCATWHDPHKKPSYLFALVAGDLAVVQDSFTTKSGKKIQLQIFVDKGNENKTMHAMESLKKSMKWDEEKFGREYDLTIFNIVAVSNFNGGAMENKGLNIFNSRFVLGTPDSATDQDYENIEGVIGHEYFHNWTGNRITCRDWFQLSLKEGLTVYRDQEFSADMGSRGVKRIDDVQHLRMLQFPEDSGPMAHPIRPDNYIEINNFYTKTVYEKGAEVIRMMATLLGAENFRKGMDRYFELYDGNAVTTEDFVAALEAASGIDLSQFKNTWYQQAGTPHVKVTKKFLNGTLELTFTQATNPTPGQAMKRPFQIPIRTAFLDPTLGSKTFETVLDFKQASQTFTFPKLEKEPVVSFLRGFSAPVKMEISQSDEELLFLMANDDDPFVQFESNQTYVLRQFHHLMSAAQRGMELKLDPKFLDTLGKQIQNCDLDQNLKAKLLEFPEENYLSQQMTRIDVDSIHKVRNFMVSSIASKFEGEFLSVFGTLESPKTYEFNPKSVGRRTLRRVVLHYLAATRKSEYLEMILSDLRASVCMTDELSALTALADTDGEERESALAHFYHKWKDDSLVMNKWFSTQALSKSSGTLSRIKRLKENPVFQANNPNHLFSLFAYYGLMNLSQFHLADGKAYEYMAEQIMEIDSKNPSVASRLASIFNHWKRFDEVRSLKMKEQLERIKAKKDLSANVFEIVSKALT